MLHPSLPPHAKPAAIQTLDFSQPKEFIKSEINQVIKMKERKTNSCKKKEAYVIRNLACELIYKPFFRFTF
jgi:hypothetical protein